MSLKKLLLISIAVVACVMHVGTALAQSCTAITSLPYVISQPGKYCLTQTLRYEGAVPVPGQLDTAILISSDDVAVDFNGYTLQGGANAAVNLGSAAVRASDRKNVTVRNGSIRNFGTGVQLSDPPGGVVSSGQLVEQMVVDGGLTVGLSVSGNNATVRDSRVSNLSSTSTLYTGIGIAVYGASARVTDNAISGIATGGNFSMGIYVNSQGSLIQSNTVSGLTGVISAFGLMAGAGSGGSVFKENVLFNATNTGSGIAVTVGATNLTVEGNAVSGFSYGISLSNAGKYKNNTVSGATFAYSGGTNIGGNN